MEALLKRFVNEDSGQDLIEYGLLIASSRRRLLLRSPRLAQGQDLLHRPAVEHRA
jgi:hypothetical protein